MKMSEGATADAEVEDTEPEVFYNITVNMPNGDKTTLKCSNKQPMIDSVTEQGVDIPYGCSDGLCGQCAAKLVKGDMPSDGAGEFLTKD